MGTIIQDYREAVDGLLAKRARFEEQEEVEFMAAHNVYAAAVAAHEGEVAARNRPPARTVPLSLLPVFVLPLLCLLMPLSTSPLLCVLCVMLVMLLRYK